MECAIIRAHRADDLISLVNGVTCREFTRVVLATFRLKQEQHAQLPYFQRRREDNSGVCLSEIVVLAWRLLSEVQ